MCMCFERDAMLVVKSAQKPIRIPLVHYLLEWNVMWRNTKTTQIPKDIKFPLRYFKLA